MAEEPIDVGSIYAPSHSPSCQTDFSSHGKVDLDVPSYTRSFPHDTAILVPPLVPPSRRALAYYIFFLLSRRQPRSKGACKLRPRLMLERQRVIRMKGRCSSLLRFILWTSFLSVWLYPYRYASAAETQEKWVARAVSVQGTVEAQRVGEAQWLPVQLNCTFRPGDKIRVLERSRGGVGIACGGASPRRSPMGLVLPACPLFSP